MSRKKKEKVVTSLKIDPETWKRTKIQAIELGITLTDALHVALKDWLEKSKKETEEEEK